ncbi:MAG: type II secretion system protein GspG [Planctomycetota bacterium]
MGTTTRRTHARGFSLLELTLVIAIMGILMGVVAFNLIGQSESARVEATKIRMNTILQEVEGQIARTGSPPAGLNELVQSKRLKTEGIIDAWDEPFFYAPKPAGQSPAFDLRSPGPDRVMQTEDDINIWDHFSPS